MLHCIILVPGPEHKKPTDYVSGLFKIDVTSKSRPSNSPFRNRNNTPSPNVTPNEENVNTPNKNRCVYTKNWEQC